MVAGPVARLWRLYQTPEGRKLFRYTMVSVICTSLGFTILAVIFYGLRVGSEAPDNVIASAICIVPSYYLNRSWAWGKTGRSHLWREVVPFWTMSFAGIALAVFTGIAARHVSIDVLHLDRMGRTAVLLMANVVAFGTLWVFKLLIINRLFHVHPVVEPRHGLEAVRIS